MVGEMNGKGSVAVQLKPLSLLSLFLEVVKQMYLKLGFSNSPCKPIMMLRIIIYCAIATRYI